jgi:hypothetical protein
VVKWMVKAGRAKTARSSRRIVPERGIQLVTPVARAMRPDKRLCVACLYTAAKARIRGMRRVGVNEA